MVVSVGQVFGPYMNHSSSIKTMDPRLRCNPEDSCWCLKDIFYRICV